MAFQVYPLKVVNVSHFSNDFRPRNMYIKNIEKNGIF
jgi:hypothetical protein